MPSIHKLASISPIDGRYAEKTTELSSYFSEFALIKHRVKIEIYWLIALSHNNEIKQIPAFSDNEEVSLHSIWKNFSLQDAEKVKDIEKTTKHDVKAVEYFLQKELKKLNLEASIPFLHFAATSEDINNLSYALMIKGATEDSLLPNLYKILRKLNDLSIEYKSTPMMARTHGQPASPTTLGKEFLNVSYRFKSQIEKIQKIEFLGKMNGAVGNYNAHLSAYSDIDWAKFSKGFIESLGLQQNICTIQIEPHDYIVNLSHAMHAVNSILLDFATDVWGYISIGYFSQKTNPNEVGSSTMPHKVNPIDFENAEGNLAISNSWLHFFATRLPISRWQRDLTDSTVLRNIGCSFAHSLIAYKSLLAGMNKIVAKKEELLKDLDNNYGLLAEPVQTVMRTYGINDAYEQLKSFTRNKNIDKETMLAFIKQLQIPQEKKDELLKTTPANYIGDAIKITSEETLKIEEWLKNYE